MYARVAKLRRMAPKTSQAQEARSHRNIVYREETTCTDDKAGHSAWEWQQLDGWQNCVPGRRVLGQGVQSWRKSARSRTYYADNRTVDTPISALLLRMPA